MTRCEKKEVKKEKKGAEKEEVGSAQEEEMDGKQQNHNGGGKEEEQEVAGAGQEKGDGTKIKRKNKGATCAKRSLKEVKGNQRVALDFRALHLGEGGEHLNQQIWR